MEKMTIESLQKKINDKADAKARKVVNELLKFMKDSGLLNIKGFNVANAENDYIEKMENCFMEIDSSYKESPVYKLYEKKLAQFIEEDTRNFVNKVNDLVDKADELLDLTQN